MIGLSQGAVLARRSYQQLLRLLMRGEVIGRWEGGRWLVDEADCRRLGAETAATTSAATNKPRKGAAA